MIVTFVVLRAMLSLIDIVIIIFYLLFSLGVGLYFTRRASRSTADYFTGGRNVSWWLGGLGMVATTFAADTPLAVTEIVRKNGIAGNWLWWCSLIGGMMTTFFFARYWRRSGVTTDLELIAIRYSGREAHLLRGFKAIYFGLILNAVIMGWVNLALVTILQVYFGFDKMTALYYVTGAMVLTTVYSSLSGLWGVLYTDAVQFIIAMAGCIVLAVVVMNHESIGGSVHLANQLSHTGLTAFFPTIGSDSANGTFGLDVWQFIAFIGVQWWASWYPGAEPGGGGYIAQRILASKNERHALGSVLFFQVMNYAVRPWPWILVGLATVVLYPNLTADTYREGFVLAMKDFLPSGLQGLLLVAFFAAYMSTIATHLNWGTSYLIQDLYRPYIEKDRSEAHYVQSARVATVLMLLFSVFVTFQLDSIKSAWEFILQFGAGTGLVLIVRWYWWRVSAWTELVAMITPALTYTALWLIRQNGGLASVSDAQIYLILVAITTVIWIASVYLFPPTDEDQLYAFCRQVRPKGFWSKYAQPENDTPLGVLVLCCLLGVMMVYGVLFGIGYSLMGNYGQMSLWIGLAIIGIGGIIGLGKRYDVFK